MGGDFMLIFLGRVSLWLMFFQGVLALPKVGLLPGLDCSLQRRSGLCLYLGCPLLALCAESSALSTHFATCQCRLSSLQFWHLGFLAQTLCSCLVDSLCSSWCGLQVFCLVHWISTMWTGLMLSAICNFCGWILAANLVNFCVLYQIFLLQILSTTKIIYTL